LTLSGRVRATCVGLEKVSISLLSDVVYWFAPTPSAMDLTVCNTFAIGYVHHRVTGIAWNIAGIRPGEFSLFTNN